MSTTIVILIVVFRIISLVFATIFIWRILKNIRRKGLVTAILGDKEQKTICLGIDKQEKMDEFTSKLKILIDELEESFREENKSFCGKDKNDYNKNCKVYVEKLEMILYERDVFIGKDLRQKLKILRDSLKNSLATISNKPTLTISFEYSLYFPILDEPLEGDWRKKVIEEQWSFPFREGIYRFPGIELMYSKTQLEAQITSEKFRKFLKCKIESLREEIDQELLNQDWRPKVMVDRIISINDDGTYIESSSKYSIRGDYIRGDYFNMSQDLTQAASQIQNLIKKNEQLEMNTDLAQRKVGEDLARQVQDDPNLKEKLRKWGQSLGDATVSEVVKETVKLALRSAGILLP